MYQCIKRERWSFIILLDDNLLCCYYRNHLSNIFSFLTTKDLNFSQNWKRNGQSYILLLNRDFTKGNADVLLLNRAFRKGNIDKLLLNRAFTEGNA